MLPTPTPYPGDYMAWTPQPVNVCVSNNKLSKLHKNSAITHEMYY